MLKVNNKRQKSPTVVIITKIEFVRIGEIDTMNDKFNAEICIESKWIEEDNNIDIDNFNPKNYWNPGLFIENTLADPKEKTNYDIIKQSNLNIKLFIRVCYEVKSRWSNCWSFGQKKL